MQITSLRQAKRDRERANVYVDGQFWAGLEQNTIAKHHLYQGLEVSLEQLAQILLEDTVDLLVRQLHAWCLIRPRSEVELKRKLSEKLQRRLSSPTRSENPDLQMTIAPAQVVNQVLARIAELGFDNEHFADWWVQERARQRRYGSRKVLSELLAQGVSAPAAKAALARHFPDQTDLRQELLAKKFGVQDIKQIADLKQRAKAYRYLQSKGL